ncbi:hypothetical protein BO86DRAFT_403258 [Aspergillus japonicus CBS 114.51]|uniref:Uncharacterized protein n=1 Tax=Aspergillus japonicus CBS 114.51 TaxID=1448312 RepID=A0A8T8WPW0_ASPJA|nr:hypothetical protein BO86DRAFT_403258 [Aspergillus japonicus CBS 114.51]RAH77836.1 hypothetical protein BO86DRAFT_403258 [Aspergillus japonicus CBS 114.51]
MAVAPSPGRPVGGSHLPPWKALGGGEVATGSGGGQLAAAGRPSLYGGGRPLGITPGPPSVCPPRSGPAGAGAPVKSLDEDTLVFGMAQSYDDTDPEEQPLSTFDLKFHDESLNQWTRW